MSTAEQIQELITQLPPEKQDELLDFAAFLKQQVTMAKESAMPTSLSDHPAFGSWRDRDIDSVEYQRKLRAEWDERA